MVNGPEDGVTGWLSVDWQQAEDGVRRLRQRIFTATQAGDLARVRNLQKLMLRSRANALMSVRRVTEINAGRKTAGIDGKTALLASQKAELADWVQCRSGPWKPKPVKRVFIPKASGRQRRLGFPSSRTGPCKLPSSVLWSPSGRRGSNRSPMVFGRAAVVMMRSRPSSARRPGATRTAGGYLTPIWRRHSTALITAT
jgi:N-terminal domain of reverse transcriptase